MAVDTQYDVGDEIPLAFDYAVGGVAADPGTLTLTLVSPAGGTNASYVYPASIDKTATGSFFVGFVAPSPGWWSYYWQAATPVDVVVQGEFYVRRLPGSV